MKISFINRKTNSFLRIFEIQIIDVLKSYRKRENNLEENRSIFFLAKTEMSVNKLWFFYRRDGSCRPLNCREEKRRKNECRILQSAVKYDVRNRRRMPVDVCGVFLCLFLLIFYQVHDDSFGLMVFSQSN